VERVARLVGAHTSAPILGVVTKADLVASSIEMSSPIAVSAKTGDGLLALLGAIDAKLASEHGAPSADDAPGLTRARHRAAVATAVQELEAFQAALNDDGIPASIAAIHVRYAADALGELIGVLHTEDVLDVVFRQFCVGK
jgi:tRNA modification GTPase